MANLQAIYWDGVNPVRFDDDVVSVIVRPSTYYRQIPTSERRLPEFPHGLRCVSVQCGAFTREYKTYMEMKYKPTKFIWC